jgi:hypothetical protein
VGEWLRPSPNLVKSRLRRHSANHFVTGPYLVNRDPPVRPNSTILCTGLLLWGVLCRQVRLSPPLGEEVGLVLLPQILRMAGVGGGVLALEVALVLELGFPPNLDLGLVPGTGPFLCPSIPW